MVSSDYSKTLDIYVDSSNTGEIIPFVSGFDYASVPEPASAVLLLTGAAAARMLRRRRV